MSESSIKSAIERVRGNTSYSSWTIGITDDPNRRRNEHGNPRHWHEWKAHSEQIARDVEAYFLEKGMKGGGGGGENPNWVYIF